MAQSFSRGQLLSSPGFGRPLAASEMRVVISDSFSDATAFAPLRRHISQKHAATMNPPTPTAAITSQRDDVNDAVSAVVASLDCEAAPAAAVAGPPAPATGSAAGGCVINRSRTS